MTPPAGWVIFDWHWARQCTATTRAERESQLPLDSRRIEFHFEIVLNDLSKKSMTFHSIYSTRKIKRNVVDFFRALHRRRPSRATTVRYYSLLLSISLSFFFIFFSIVKFSVPHFLPIFKMEWWTPYLFLHFPNMTTTTATTLFKTRRNPYTYIHPCVDV